MPSPAQAAHDFVIEEWVLLAVALLVIAIRTWTRLSIVGIKNFQLDDYLMLFVAVLYSLESAAAYIVGAWYHGLANSGMTPEQRAALDPTSAEYQMRIAGSKVQVTGWSMYTLLLWCIKLCLCVFYGRLTSGVTNVFHIKMRVRIGYVLIAVTYIATILSILLACRPLSRNWQINPDPGNVCQPAISKVNCIVTVVLNVLTDLYLISIPLPMLWKVQIKLTEKALLIAMFSGGFFVIACGILRAALILTDPVNGAQQAGSWAVRETFVSVVMSNLPIIYHRVRAVGERFFRSIIDYGSGVRSRIGYGSQTREKSQGYGTSNTFESSQPATELGNMKRSSKIGYKKSKFLHPLSLRNATMTGSEERIVDQDGDMGSKRGGVTVKKEVTVETSEVRNSSEEGSSHRTHGDYIYQGPAYSSGNVTHRRPSGDFSHDRS